jgi:ABC-type transporter Mla subunit MlaD
MAEEFTADRQEAAKVSRDLTSIRAALDGGEMGALDARTGSEKVDEAVRTFFAESADNRERVNRLLERAAGLLDALVEGTGELDRSLAGLLSTRTGRT